MIVVRFDLARGHMSRIRTIKPEDWKNQNQAWNHGRANIYLVQEGDEDLIKVGIAGHPLRRLSALQAGNWRRLHLRRVYSAAPSLCVHIERHVLRYFAKRRVSGEWLRCGLVEVADFVDSFEEVPT